MIKNTTNMLVRVCALAAAMLSTTSYAAQPSHPADQEGWYGSIAIGRVFRPDSTDTRVDLGGVSLSGETTFGNGTSGALAIGRQIWTEDRDKPAEFNLWRIEGELWSASLARRAFNVGVMSAPLADDMRVTGLFLNALTRVYETENTRWWLGGGIGWAQVKLSDTTGTDALCGCLAAAKGSGAAFRVKGRVERFLSEKSAVFLELGYTGLPDASIGTGALPKTTYDRPHVLDLLLGLRMKF